MCLFLWQPMQAVTSESRNIYISCGIKRSVEGLLIDKCLFFLFFYLFGFRPVHYYKPDIYQFLEATQNMLPSSMSKSNRSKWQAPCTKEAVHSSFCVINFGADVRPLFLQNKQWLCVLHNVCIPFPPFDSVWLSPEFTDNSCISWAPVRLTVARECSELQRGICWFPWWKRSCCGQVRGPSVMPPDTGCPRLPARAAAHSHTASGETHISATIPQLCKENMVGPPPTNEETGWVNSSLKTPHIGGFGI